MYLTEELLTQWTGLKGRDLSIFYLSYKQRASNPLFHGDLDYIKQDILKFKEGCYNQNEVTGKVKTLVNFWESKLKR
jgi:hypothetical protein